jgi:L-threonylcarbamoyladenylate synthase
VLDAVTGGQDTVAVRVPAHPVAQALLRAFGGGVAAPSANRFGRVSATTAAHVRAEFGEAVDVVLDGGACDVGIESTIVDVSGTHPALLRPGGVSLTALESTLGEPLALAGLATPRAPGTLAAHYAPTTPLMLIDADVAPELVRTLVRQEKKIAVLSFSALQPVLPGLTWIAASPDAGGYAHDLYANLRKLDATHSDVIVIERPPQHPEWFAVLDRLTRAATGSTAFEQP